MKVQGPAPSSLSLPGRSAPSAAAGFEPVSAEARTSAAARPGAVAAAASLDMLLALQETAGPNERRRKAARRGHGILDALDALKLSTFDEAGLDAAALDRLQGELRTLRDRTDDPGLDDILDQIELRAAVELAKRERYSLA